MIRSLGGKTPKIHPTAFVSEAAYVVGDVEIGEGSSILPGTIIRGNHHKITIGKYVNIQDNCVIHSDAPALFGDYVTLGHHVICHSTTVEEYCLLGNGAVVNGDAVIRHHSVVAAGSVVLERADFPPNSFIVGAPAGVKSQTSERHIKMIEGVANGYHKVGQLFKSDGLEDADRDDFNSEG